MYTTCTLELIVYNIILLHVLNNTYCCQQIMTRLRSTKALYIKNTQLGMSNQV